MPSINGGMKCIKYLLFLFNLIFVVFGIALVWIGFSVKEELSKYFNPILTINGGEDGGHSIPPTIFIVAGFIMFLIAFLGCCGAVTENHCMMMLYSVLVGLVLVIQLGAAIAAYAFQDDVENAVSAGMEKSLHQYFDADAEMHNDTVTSWNFFQSNWKCCGPHNFTDWGKVDNAPQENFIPTSCCIDGAFENCSNSITRNTTEEEAAKHIYTVGCVPRAIRALSITHLGTIGIVAAVVETIGIICACMMARSIRFSYETV